MSKNRTAFAIAMFLTLTIAVTLVALPAANAHDPPWTKDTWMYVAVSPSPVGVGQQVLITWWTDLLPQTAQGDYGDRWHDVTVTITAPNGDKKTLTQAKSDPVGGGYFLYTPDQVGTYTLQGHFPGHTYTGEPQPPWGLPSSYAAYIGDVLNPSDSEIIELVVQEEEIPEWQETPLPTDYWSRPIYGENRFWNRIGGNWLNYPIAPGRANINVKSYVAAPETAHIVWTRPYWLGGLVGGDFGSTPYYDGLSYERLWRTPILIHGRLYYSVDAPPRYGHYCIDLRTGEEIWFQNSTGPLEQYGSGGGGTRGSGDYTKYSFGQILNIDNPNQHGAFAYLWSTYGSTWQMYDAWTGNWICNIENVPSGAAGRDSNGNLLRYIYNNNGWLALWNSTTAIWRTTLDWGGNNYWAWRPLMGYTFDGNDGIEWNVTAPAGLGSIFTVLDDRLLGNRGLGSFEYATNAYSLWCLDISSGNEGELMWKKDYAQPPVKNATITPGPASLEEGLMTIALKETRQWIAYDIDTGNKVWGPTESQDPYDMYDFRRGSGCGEFVSGKLLSWGYAGKVYCYDATDGSKLWEEATESGGFDSYFDSGRYPLSLGALCGDKIYLYSSEHSPSKPLWRGSKIRCIDIELGETLWAIDHWANNPAVADGYLVDLDNYDCRIYCYGKGPSATTVSVSPKISTHGNSVLIEGMVTDESPGTKGSDLTARFPHGVPAIADEYMTEWSEFLYKQKSMPTAEGVEVKLETLDPNNNFYEIGRVTSDANGMYSYVFTPEVPGLYTIMATFEGSESYFGSRVQTAINVEEVPQASPTPTPPPPSMADIYIVPGIVGIIIAIVVVGLVIILMLRKR